MEGLKDSDKKFLFGAAMSAHQVEGGSNNQWSKWEKLNAQKLAKYSEKNKGWLKNWLEIKLDAQSPENYISADSSDHYNLYPKDFELAKELNLNALRSEIPFSRIMPKEGQIDFEQIKHYKEYIQSMIDRGITPIITLFHWTVPEWFEEKGGLRDSRNLKYFFEFVSVIATEFKDLVQIWITVNEPRIYAAESFLSGRWPPQKKNFFTFLNVLNNLKKINKESYKIIKEINPNAQVGFAENIASYSSDNKFYDQILLNLFIWFESMMLEDFVKYSDFIGLNYYFHRIVKNGRATKLGDEYAVSDLGWDLYPQGISEVLNRISSFKKPIMITENGLADAKDEFRSWFIRVTLESIFEAKKKGVDIIGYLHWSLIDNFEWDTGFWARFGLIEIDYKTKKRIKRESALLYSKLIEVYKEKISKLES